MSELSTILAGMMATSTGHSYESVFKLQEFNQAELIYVLEPCIAGNHLQFNIDVIFQGSADGKTMLRLPSEWAGQKRLYDSIKFLQASSPGTIITDTDNPCIKAVTHAPNQAVIVKYQLHQDWTGSLLDSGKYYRSILQKEYFHFVGEAAFVHPEWNDERTLRIVLQWKNLPKDWVLSNSFGVNQNYQVVERTISQVRDAVYVGGDFRVERIYINGNSLYVAIRGHWKFSDKEFFDLIKRIVEAERAFWHDYDFPYFLITLIPTGERCCYYVGTGLTDSFATFISTDKPIDNRLKHLFAHELFHTWNGKKIGLQKPEELVYWFSEGFTEYYTRLLLLRSGLINLEEYVQDYNKAIYDYYSSPVRNAENKRIMKDFWKVRGIQQLPYQRGDILAHNWNTSIRLFSNGRFSLDNVMLDLLKAARTEGMLVSDEALDRSTRPYLIQGIRNDVDKYINKGNLILPNKAALGPCIELKMERIGQFDLGFDYQASLPKHIVEGVKEGSSAYHSGLRNGQEIVERSIFFGDPTRTVEIKVKDSKGERLIKFYPAGKKIKVPQYKLNLQMYRADQRSCLSWFYIGTLPLL